MATQNDNPGAAPAPTERTWLAVPYADKDLAREAGARWDQEAKAWYAPATTDLQKFERWTPKPELAQTALAKQTADPRIEFAQAIKLAGLIVEGDPVMDGKLHRVPVVDGKPRAKDGAYVGYLDARPSGHIQNFLTGHKESWTTVGMQLTDEERAQLAAQAQLAKLRRAADLEAQHEEAAKKSLAKWERLPSEPANGDNAYLSRKGIGAHGVKFDGHKLVVPVRDVDGKLWSLQSIGAEEGGRKLFEKGGRKTGNMHVIGDIKAGEAILVAEGYATGATLHQATGKTVAVAFDSGNIDSVVGALKQRHPENPIYIMGDDDRQAKRNVGVEKALAAAQKHQVGVAYPEFASPGKASDFNDLQAQEGAGSVKAQVEKALSQSMAQSREQAAVRFNNTEAAVELATQAATEGKEKGERLTASDATIGAAHVAQVAQVGGPVVHTAVQAIGIVDAARIASDVADGKEVRALDAASAAASVAMTAGVGGPAVQAGAQAIAGVSAIDAGRRAINTLDEPASSPPPSAEPSAPSSATSTASTAASPVSLNDHARVLGSRDQWARIADQPNPHDVALRASIDQGAIDAMAVPRDAIPASDAKLWVREDVAAFRSIKTPAERVDAAYTMGHNASQQIQYKLELAAHDPEVAALTARVYMQERVRLIDQERRDSSLKVWQEFTLSDLVDRHAPIRAEATSLERAPKERIETMVREDILALYELRDHAGESRARNLVREAFKNEAYRETFQREASALDLDFDIARPGRLDAAKLKEAELADASQRKTVERRSTDMLAVPQDALGVAAAREAVALDLASFRATEQARERVSIALVMGENAKRQKVYKAELARLDPEIAKAVDLVHGRASRGPDAGAAQITAEDAWLLPVFARGNFTSERVPQASAQITEASPSRSTRISFTELNSIDHVSRDQQFDDAGAAAIRKQIAQHRMDREAARAFAPSTEERVLDTIGRMTRPELDAYVRARQVSEDQADKVLLSAQRRIEGEVDLRAGRKAVPPLEERFSVVHHIARREYQFRDQPGQTAFVERWLSMQSAHEAPVVVKAMLDRADERGWTHVRVNGSVEFQRQAWIAATARGIKAVGYEPTDGDRTAAVEERARLDKERGQTQAQTGGTITREATREQTVPAWANPLVSSAVDRAAIDPRQPASARSADTPSAPSMPAPAASPTSRRAAGEPAIAEPLRRFLLARGESGQDVEAMVALASTTMKHERVYVGQVVARGTDHFEFNADNDRSPFVTLRGPRGDHTVWGVDLPRALDEAKVQVGDGIALEHRGMQPVTVSVKDRDPAGKVIGAHEEVGRRNTWFAVGIEQLRADPARSSSTPLEQTASSDSKGAQRSQPTQRTAQETATPSTTASMAQATARSAAPATKDSDAMVAAAFEAAIAAKNVPLNLRDALRENFRKELAERHARGETARVKVYDPSASRLPTRTVAPPPQRQRDEQERAR
jgi:phage/plasmid primase-like uncharacterized protein